MLLSEVYDKNEQILNHALQVQNLLKQALEKGVSLNDDIINCGNAYLYYTSTAGLTAQSTNRGSVKDVVYNIKNGTIEKAYLGGEAASDVSGTLNSMQCNISGGSITNLYLGTDGSTAKSSTEEYVERKLDISKVTGTYIDGVIKNAEDGLLEKLVKQ